MAGIIPAICRYVLESAFLTDRSEFLLVIHLRTVLNQEAAHAGELVILWWKYDNVELHVREICTSELKTTWVICVF